MVNNKKKLTVMSPIRRRMKKRNPSSGHNGQLVHWWLLIHSGHVIPPLDFCPLRPQKGLEWTSSHQCTSSGWGHSSRFGDEPKTHPLPLRRDFSAPFSAPKFSPPTSLTSFPTHSISRARGSSWAWVTQSLEKRWDTRLEEEWHKASRRHETQGLRKVERRS